MKRAAISRLRLHSRTLGITICGATAFCVDAGVDPTGWLNNADVLHDMDGEKRPSSGGWDIGADEAAY